MAWMTCLVLVLWLLSLTDSILSDEPEPIIGIDLGTKYSKVGIFKNGDVEIIPNEYGRKRTPSYVAFKENGERLIGDSAMSQLSSNPKNTIFNVKHFIGRTWNSIDPKEVENYRFNIIEKNNKPYIKVLIGENEKVFAPEEISAMVLGKMKEIAERYLKRKITKAVITVPLCFGKYRRQATKDAGTIAGLEVLKIMSEPTASVVAHGLINRGRERYVLVFALGWGFFDCSLITVDQGIFQVEAICEGDLPRGEYFNRRVTEDLIRIYRKKTGISLSKSSLKDDLLKIQRDVERAVQRLSYQNQTQIEIEGPKHFSYTLTRSRFAELTMDLCYSMRRPADKVLSSVGLKKEDVDEIILTGGLARVPGFRKVFTNHFNGKEPVSYVNIDEAAAYGAAVQGAVLSRADQVSDVVMLEVNPFNVWYQTVDSTVDSLHPLHLTGLPFENTDMLLLPHLTGLPFVNTDRLLLPRNTRLPFVKTLTFTITHHSPQNMVFQLFESSHLRSMYRTETVLVRDIPRPYFKNGEYEMEVIFEFAAVDSMAVLAKVKYTKREIIETEIQSRNWLSQKEKDYMIREANAFAENDKIVKEIADAKDEL